MPRPPVARDSNKPPPKLGWRAATGRGSEFCQAPSAPLGDDQSGPAMAEAAPRRLTARVARRNRCIDALVTVSFGCPLRRLQFETLQRMVNEMRDPRRPIVPGAFSSH